MNSGKPKVSIIVVNYNGANCISRCLDALGRFLDVPYEVLVVDNASTDSSVEIIRKEFPHVTLIVCPENYGFARANNIGSRSARGEFLLLVNNDAFLHAGIGEALLLFSKSPKLGVIGGKMFSEEGNYRFSAGHFPSPLRLLKISSVYKRDGCFRDGNFPANRDIYYHVDWIEGSLLLTRKTLWNCVGGFDETYFMYGEDVDYCRQVKECGFDVGYTPNIRYVHIGGFAENRLPMVIKGFLRFHCKFSNCFVRHSALVCLTFSLCIKIIVFGCFLQIHRTEKNRVKFQSCIRAIKELSV